MKAIMLINIIIADKYQHQTGQKMFLYGNVI